MKNHSPKRKTSLSKIIRKSKSACGRMLKNKLSIPESQLARSELAEFIMRLISISPKKKIAHSTKGINLVGIEIDNANHLHFNEILTNKKDGKSSPREKPSAEKLALKKSAHGGGLTEKFSFILKRY